GGCVVQQRARPQGDGGGGVEDAGHVGIAPGSQVGHAPIAVDAVQEAGAAGSDRRGQPVEVGQEAGELAPTPVGDVHERGDAVDGFADLVAATVQPGRDRVEDPDDVVGVDAVQHR